MKETSEAPSTATTTAESSTASSSSSTEGNYEDSITPPTRAKVMTIRPGDSTTLAELMSSNPSEVRGILSVAAGRVGNGTVQRAISLYKTREAAARGTATGTTKLPHADRIQESFGPSHDVRAIEAHVGGDTAHEMGATAYASGNHVVFDREPDLHTAAHEAAHVMQQNRGVQLAGGVGSADDEHQGSLRRW